MSKAPRRTGHPTNGKEWRKRLAAHGLVITITRGKHLKITHPDKPGAVFAAQTPSDHRAFKNNARDVRRVFGIDLRTVP